MLQPHSPHSTHGDNAPGSLEACRAQIASLKSQLLHAREGERRRLAANLHDDLVQLLAALKLKLRPLCESAPRDQTGAALKQAMEILQQAIDTARGKSWELQPADLPDGPLIPALRNLAGRLLDQYGLSVDVDCIDDWDDQLTNAQRLALFRCTRELLINCAKHAVVSRAVVNISCGDDELIVEVADKGVGFDVAAATRPDADGAGFGLFSVRERMASVGGEVEFRSAPGTGTCVSLRVPMN